MEFGFYSKGKRFLPMTQCIQAYNKDVSSYLSISLYIFIMYMIRILFSIKITGID